MNKFFTFIFFNILVLSGSSQIQLIAFDSIPIQRNAQPLSNAWAGGFNCPQFSEIDLNNDGKKDLVTFERNFYGVVKTFINTGNAGESVYKYDPSFRMFFPQMRNWMLLRDYNCDGKEDIFTSVPAGIAVYRNDSEGANLKFSQVTFLLIGEGLNGPGPVYVSPPDIPAIEDIDGDGDLDILSFNIVGSTVEYHKNLSMELYGNCSALEFELKNTCWGYFIEDNNNNNVTLFDTCDVNVPNPEKSEKHPGSSLLAIDLSGNGVKDILIGDINYPNLIMLTNGGTNTSAVMKDFSGSFPPNTTPVNITMFPASYFLDADNDGLKDLIVAPNNPNTSENFNNVWLYKNVGDEMIPAFEFQKSNFLFDEMIDVGERSFPVFFDENSDGLSDIVAGNFGYFEEAGSYSSQLMLLRNTGTATDPAFEVVNADYSSLGQLGFNGIYPAFGDMDDDGDDDMISGDEDGSLHFFRNNGGSGNHADFILTEAFYFGIDVGQSAKPQIVDINRDGLPDLLVGERSGTLNYFENSGTPGQAVFTAAPSVEEFGNVDVMPDCCTGYSAPFMTTDSLGRSILYVGSEQGMLYLFSNIDNNLDGTFDKIDSLYTQTINLSISGADLDGDGFSEFVTGEFPGGIGFLKKGNPPSLGISDNKMNENLVKVYPNPAKDFINIKLEKTIGNSTIQLSDIMGKAVLRESLIRGEHYKNLDISNLARGIYFLHINVGTNLITKKVVIE
ncbi:MAG: T9SS type A sorting domain-containing protein [Bacteroidales bacterium]|nr:T9SS type A sorting domain-containing protein [Bacteroidales bacterium]